MQGGAPANKLAIGLAVYGRSLELTDSNDNGMGAPIKGAAPAGPFTREKGFWAYYEVSNIKENLNVKTLNNILEKVMGFHVIQYQYKLLYKLQQS